MGRLAAALPAAAAALVCAAGHSLTVNRRPLRGSAFCDLCGATGTAHICSAGCDYDVCLQCFEENAAAAVAAVSAPCGSCGRTIELAELADHEFACRLGFVLEKSGGGGGGGGAPQTLETLTPPSKVVHRAQYGGGGGGVPVFSISDEEADEAGWAALERKGSHSGKKASGGRKGRRRGGAGGAAKSPSLPPAAASHGSVSVLPGVGGAAVGDFERRSKGGGKDRRQGDHSGRKQ